MLGFTVKSHYTQQVSFSITQAMVTMNYNIMMSGKQYRLGNTEKKQTNILTREKTSNT